MVYWLISLDETTATVACVTSSTPPLRLGLSADYVPNDPASLIEAVNASMLAASTAASFAESEEPDSAGFVVPPFWVDSDGKINSAKLATIEKLCKQLGLKPLGFVPGDEAVVEYFSSQNSFPQSFILINFDRASFVVSLVIVGKITQRIRQPFSLPFDPQTISDSFSLFPPEAVFPPQIYLFGQIDPATANAIAGFRWPPTSGRDFFLHLPEVIRLKEMEVFTAFSSVIAPPKPTESLPAPPPHPPPADLEEVGPQSLGFAKDDTPPPPPAVIHPSLPKIKIPKFKLNLKAWLILPLLLLLVATLYYLPTATLTLYLTPLVLDKTFPVTLDPKATSPNFSAGLLPTTLINLDVSSSATINTTGTKIVGDKAKGEVIVYNKTSQIQNLPRGLILAESGGKKYELASPLQVPASIAKLEQGIIEMGQTKVSLVATDIGPEFNLNPNITFKFKDYPETELLARSTSEISGGSRSEVKVVSQADKTKLTQSFTNDNLAVSPPPDFLSGSWKSTTAKIDFSREVGETTDTLTATAKTTLTGHRLSPQIRSDLLRYLISLEPDLNSANFDPVDFSFEYTPNSLSVKGGLTPKIDSTKVAQLVVGRRPDLAFNLLRQSYSRLYQWRFTSPLNLVNIFNLFPLNPHRINVEVKSQ